MLVYVWSILMKSNSRLAVTVFSLILIFLLGAAPSIGLADDAPIHIEADKMTSTEKTNSVVFTGEVDAKQGDVRIRTDKMTVYYTAKDSKGSKAQKEKKATQQVEKLICVGNVEITRGEWLGTSKQMIYLSKERQVILTDNAKAWQGQNMVSGDKIIYYLDEGRSEVVGKSSTTVGSSAGSKKKSRVNMTILQN